MISPLLKQQQNEKMKNDAIFRFLLSFIRNYHQKNEFIFCSYSLLICLKNRNLYLKKNKEENNTYIYLHSHTSFEVEGLRVCV